MHAACPDRRHPACQVKLPALPRQGKLPCPLRARSGGQIRVVTVTHHGTSPDRITCGATAQQPPENPGRVCTTQAEPLITSRSPRRGSACSVRSAPGVSSEVQQQPLTDIGAHEYLHLAHAGKTVIRRGPPLVRDNKAAIQRHRGVTCDRRAIASGRPRPRTGSHGHSAVAGYEGAESAFALVRALETSAKLVVRGGVEPPTFRFSGRRTFAR
jgi:hypothetical protein